MDAPDGSVGHAELAIGDSVVMVAAASERWPATPGNIHLYVDDRDATYAKALAAGATSIQEPSDQFYGDRSSGSRPGRERVVDRDARRGRSARGMQRRAAAQAQQND